MFRQICGPDGGSARLPCAIPGFCCMPTNQSARAKPPNDFFIKPFVDTRRRGREAERYLPCNEGESRIMGKGACAILSRLPHNDNHQLTAPYPLGGLICKARQRDEAAGRRLRPAVFVPHRCTLIGAIKSEVRT
jgi:hypothetical protein